MSGSLSGVRLGSPVERAARVAFAAGLRDARLAAAKERAGRVIEEKVELALLRLGANERKAEAK